MLPGRTYTPEDVFRILRRRWWLVLVPFVVGTVAGVAAYRWLPPKFRSETLIMVVPQRIPNDYVRSTVTLTVEDRLRSISEEILSRSRLERIVQDLSLYQEHRGGSPMEEVIRRMRGDIDVAVEGIDTSFRLAYSHLDPRVAQAVTARLADLYIEENLRDRAARADGTSEFLQSQLEDAKERLIAQERKLEEYRRRYSGQLPSQLEGNLQALQSAQMQLQSLADSTNRARERRLLIERQIADAMMFPGRIAEGHAPDRADEATLSTANRLRTARSRLRQLAQQYTADHPDVVAEEETIRELQRRLALEAKEPPETKSPEPLSDSEVAQRKRLGDLQGELDIIDRQLAAGQEQEAALKATLVEYRAKIDSVPKRESELVELTRDYSTLQETYASLLRKREESEIAADLERRQIGEQFKVLDPASLPERPYNERKRFAALAAGAIGGLGLGLLLVGLLEYRDSSFRSEDEVHRILSLPVLALIPELDSRPDRHAERRSVA